MPIELNAVRLAPRADLGCQVEQMYHAQLWCRLVTGSDEGMHGQPSHAGPRCLGQILPACFAKS